MASNTKKRKLHLARIPAYGTSVLTKCGRKKNTNETEGFTNPSAKLCEQCNNLATEEGLTVHLSWKGDINGGTWSIRATPPMLERVGNTIIDRNNPDAAPVYIETDKLLALSQLSLDDYYDVHGPTAGELATG